MTASVPSNPGPIASNIEWSPESWRKRPMAHEVAYADGAAVERVVAKLRSLPPLVTSWEIERLKALLAEAEEGKRFVLQGGDCAEMLADCQPARITNKLKILLQMSLVLIHGLKRPVVRIGRFAGQYAKPRSSAAETRDGVTLPSYFGDLYNASDFSPAARTPDPALMLAGYQHAAMTLNFIRALVDGGFADLHHPEYWDLAFMRSAALSPAVREAYAQMTSSLGDGLRFMEALGEAKIEELSRVDFYASHEGLNLLYESAQTQRVPRREGHYTLTTHLPWIGERTRSIDGAHVEFFRGVRNPVGIKIGPKVIAAELADLLRRLNPANEAGKIVIITRLGAANVRPVLPALLSAISDAGLRGLWICDPMHGNTRTTAGGVKTRSFDDIRDELDSTIEVFQRAGRPLGGVHFELTGEDVTECTGGSTGVTEQDLSSNYASLCDPRLNYQQSLELAFLLAHRLAR